MARRKKRGGISHKEWNEQVILGDPLEAKTYTVVRRKFHGSWWILIILLPLWPFAIIYYFSRSHKETMKVVEA